MITNKFKKKLKSIFLYFKELNSLSNKINLQIENSNAILKKIINDKPINKIKVAFLIHNIDAWYSVGEIIHEMLQDDRFEVFTFSINKKFPGEKKFSGEEKVHQFLTHLNIPHIRLNMQDSFSGLSIIKKFEPNVLFRQSQWDDDYPPGYSTLYLNFTNLAYISYEIANPIVNVPLNEDIIDSGVDSIFHRSCWIVFCANEDVIEQAKLGKLNGRQFVATGHPKIDFHLNNRKKYWPQEDKGQTKILWTGHHSILKGWNNFGMFHLVYKDMLAWAKNSSEISFVLRLHPALRTLLKSKRSPVSKKDINYFFNEWSSLPNCSIYNESNYPELLNASTYIVTDSPSMIIEGQFYQKPIFFLDREDRVSFNEIGKKLEDGLIKVKNIVDIKKHLEIKNNQAIEDSVIAQKKNIEDLFYLRNSSKNIREVIYSLFHNKFYQ